MRTALLLATALLAPLAFCQDAVTLKRVAKEGESVKYKLAVDTEFGGIKIKLTANVVEKVVKAGEDGTVTVTSEQQDIMLDMGSGAQPAASEAGQVVTTVFRPDGTVADLKGDSVSPEAFRLSNLQAILWPKEAVQAGSKWNGEIKEDKEKGSVGVTIAYEISAREKIGSHDCFKVAFDSKETQGAAPAATKGTLWVDVATGLMVKLESDWTNMPIQGELLNGKVKLELSE